VNGLGERPGNAPLEEVVTALELLYDVKTRITKGKLYETSRVVRNLTKMPLAPNKPLMGDNAFTHESGMHVHGTLADKSLYEPMDAAINALRKALTGRAMNDLRLEEYHVGAITGGTDALVNVVVKISRGDKTMTASGVSEDIVIASLYALINGANRLYR